MLLKPFSVILLFFISITTLGQKIRIVKEENFPSVAINPEIFRHIENDYDLNEAAYIATFNCNVTNSGKSTLVNVFNLFWKKANQLGANAFQIDTINSIQGTLFIELSVYNLNDYSYNKMLKLIPVNMIYVIGGIDNKRSSRNIKFNNKKLLLDPMSFIAFQNNVDEEATLSIGGFMGAKLWVKGKENRLPKHLSLSGFGIGPGHYNNVGVNFNTGRIYDVEFNFGQFLVHVLKEVPFD